MKERDRESYKGGERESEGSRAQALIMNLLQSDSTCLHCFGLAVPHTHVLLTQAQEKEKSPQSYNIT